MSPSAIDCHAHVIDPARFPLDPLGRGYRPGPDETGTAAEYRTTLVQHGFSHGVLVQPSCYAYDNSALLDAVAAGGGATRGIVVVPPTASPADLVALSAKGAVGLRLNFGSFDAGFLDHPAATTLLLNAADAGFIVEAYAVGDAWERIAPVLASCGARILVDHFGEPDTSRGLDQPGFTAVLALARQSDAYVKISSIFRVSRRSFPHDDVDPFVRAAVNAFGPERCVWGSDWPFLGAGGRVSYDDMLACLDRLLPDTALRQAVLRDTPARLFGFALEARGVAAHG